MALTNAQRQARYRDRRNWDATALTGKPREVADRILARGDASGLSKSSGRSASGYVTPRFTAPPVMARAFATA
jgi:hypothetical protein